MSPATWRGRSYAIVAGLALSLLVTHTSARPASTGGTFGARAGRPAGVLVAEDHIFEYPEDTDTNISASKPWTRGAFEVHVFQVGRGAFVPLQLATVATDTTQYSLMLPQRCLLACRHLA